MAQYAIIKKSDNSVVATMEAENASNALDTLDPGTYEAQECKTLINAQLGYNLDGLYCEEGWFWDASSGKYNSPQPYPNTPWVLNSDRKWEAPTPPTGGYKLPNYYSMSYEVSEDYKWDDTGSGSWVSRTDPLTTQYSG